MKGLSKRLSWLLRHAPEELGGLAAGGWAPVARVLQALGVDRATLEAIVAGGDKRRFELDGERDLIRATHGHSTPVALELPPAVPPDRLFHGTPERALEAIRVEGLLPRARQLVHLAATPEAARQVGARHGRPVVLEVDSARMHADGHVFHQAPSGVWLTARVPAGYLAFPPAGAAPRPSR